VGEAIGEKTANNQICKSKPVETIVPEMIHIDRAGGSPDKPEPSTAEV